MFLLTYLIMRGREAIYRTGSESEPFELAILWLLVIIYFYFYLFIYLFIYGLLLTY